MKNYENVKLEKSLYRGVNFTSQLERLDPSEAYENSDLSKLDAFQRQLKRFDIKVGGSNSDKLEKFFATTDITTLFPEYISRAVNSGVEANDLLSMISATKTNIDSMDYRSITSDITPDAAETYTGIIQGAAIPETTIKLRDTLVPLAKYGRMLSASYEAVKFQKIDLFTVALKQIGSYISKAQLKAAVNILVNGDGEQPAANIIYTATANTLSYTDLLNLWKSFGDFEMNVMLASPDVIIKILNLEEFKNPACGINFQGTGKLSTPLGATLIKCPEIAPNTIVALDKRFALETVTAGGIVTDYDKLIDKQLERTAITSICGFSKIFPEAVKVLSMNPQS